MDGLYILVVNPATISFFEIADAMAATPHARKMAGLFIAFFPEIGKPGIISKTCASPEFAEAVADTWDVDIDYPLLQQGLLSPERVRMIADMALTTDYQPYQENHGYDAALIALGSPLLGSHLDTILSRIPPLTDVLPTDAGRMAVRNALFGNPLVHKANVMPKSSSSGLWAYLHNAVAFGNLDNKYVVNDLLLPLQALVNSNNSEENRRMYDIVRFGLYSRPNVPRELIVGLRDAPQRCEMSHNRLVAMAGHQQMVLDGETDAILTSLSLPWGNRVAHKLWSCL